MNNLNTDFLLDIWADLKAKRLAPVAVGFAVAIVAMPALLLKGEETPSAGPLPIVAAPTSSASATEVEVDEELADGSKLDSYKAHDPFDGAVKPGGGDSGKSGTAVAPTDATGGGAATDIGSILGGGSAPSSPPSSVPGYGQPTTGGSLTTGGGSPNPVAPQRRNFTYELDVKFGRPGSEKRFPHLSRMSFLPNRKAPALLFMGVPADEKSAIFFVYPTISHAGEGICIPSKTHCNFLELRIGRDHFLTLGDHEYRIHLIGIDTVKMDAQDDQARKSADTRRAGRAGDEASGDEGEADYWPLIVDGVG